MAVATLKQYLATLTASGSLGSFAKINAVGTMFFVRQVTPALNQLRVILRAVELSGKSGDSIELRMSQNDKVVIPFAYDRIEIYNDNAVALDVDVIFGDGDFVRPLPDIVNVAVALAGAQSQVSFVDEDISAAGLTAVMPANANRVRAVITAHINNADAIRVGGSDIDVDQGTPLQPGETIVIESLGIIYAIEEASTGTNLVCLREELRTP